MTVPRYWDLIDRPDHECEGTKTEGVHIYCPDLEKDAGGKYSCYGVSPTVLSQFHFPYMNYCPFCAAPLSDKAREDQS